MSVDVGSEQADDFVAAASSFSNLKRLRLTGNTSTAMLDVLFEALDSVPSLEHISFSMNMDGGMPSNIGKLARLRTVEIRPIGLSGQADKQTFELKAPDRNLEVTMLVPAGEAAWPKRVENAFNPGQLFPDKRLIPFQKKWKNVRPPVKTLQLERFSFAANATEASVLNLPSGTKISVPANALEDAAGQPVTGEVQFDYREFRNPIDIFASGIPMKYDSAGRSEFLQSAGMFELVASVDGQEVFLAEGQTMKVDFPSERAGSYNLYEYADSTGGWRFDSPAPVVVADGAQEKQEQRAQGYSNAWQMYQRLMRENGRWRFCMYADSLSLNARFAHPSYKYINNTEGCSLWTSKAVRYTKSQKRHGLFTFKKYRGEHPREELWLEVKYPRALFPELNCFDGLLFVSTSNEMYRAFKRLQVNGRKFFDCRVEFDSGTGNFELVLKDEAGKYVRLPGYWRVKRPDEKGLATSRNQADRWFSSYQRALASRGKRFDRQIARKQKKYLKRNKLNLATMRAWQTRPDSMNWEACKPFMAPQELEMSLQEWKTYCRETRDGLLVSINELEASPQNLTRSLAISGFGIWNCDQIYRVRYPARLIAAAKVRDNAGFKPTQYFWFDESLNGVLNFTTRNVVVSRHVKGGLVAVDGNGKMAICESQYLPKLEADNGRTQLQFEPLEVQTTGELLLRLGLN